MSNKPPPPVKKSGRQVIIDFAPEMVQLLHDCAKEIFRLHDVHGERYEGKIGEPDKTPAVKALALLRRLNEQL